MIRSGIYVDRARVLAGTRAFSFFGIAFRIVVWNPAFRALVGVAQNLGVLAGVGLYGVENVQIVVLVHAQDILLGQILLAVIDLKPV